MTILKIAALFLLITGILFSGSGSWNNVVAPSPVMPAGSQLFNAYIAAIAGAFWAYDGWNNITFVGGEIQNAQKNIPASLFIGLLTIIVIYSLVNLSYEYVLPIQKMSNSSVVASDAATVVWGAIRRLSDSTDGYAFYNRYHQRQHPCGSTCHLCYARRKQVV